jgi:hypothetical protein
MFISRHLPLLTSLVAVAIISAPVCWAENSSVPASDGEKAMTFFEMADRKAKLVGEIADLRQRIAENKKKLPNIESAEETLGQRKDELQKVVDEIAKLDQKDPATTQALENLNARRARAQQDIKVAQNDLEGENSASLKTAIKDGEAALQRKLTEQQELERKILEMRTPAQEFKSQLSMIFAALIGAVIIGFFIIAYVDDKVRTAIFSGQAGIQFLTLFSLVIAIILFGITGILEGKELAALLGGLSGYILGRSNNDKPASP